MENSNFIVRVPEPCHEDWNKMKPEEKGRFCNSCSKTVVDFSNKTDYEIKKVLEESPKGHVCGHFKKTQLDRPLNYKIDLKNLPKNISTTKAFAIALFLVFGSILFSCTNEKDQNVNVVGEIAAVPPVIETTGTPMLTYQAPYLNDSIEEVQTLEGEIVCDIETFVNGGVGYDERTVIKDSIVGEEVIVEVPDRIEYMTMGLMTIEIVQQDTTVTPTDSTGRKIQIGDNVISKITDLSVYPNPGTGDFTIKYDVTKRADIKIDIYDLKGSLIKTVVNQPSQYEGKYQIPVNLNEIPAGIYIVNLINGEKKFTEKVVISK